MYFMSLHNIIVNILMGEIRIYLRGLRNQHLNHFLVEVHSLFVDNETAAISAQYIGIICLSNDVIISYKIKVIQPD